MPDEEQEKEESVTGNDRHDFINQNKPLNVYAFIKQYHWLILKKKKKKTIYKLVAPFLLILNRRRIDKDVKLLLM